MEALYRYYQNAATDVRRVWLSAGVDHFHSSFGDKGWGCGYRNFQAILKENFKKLFRKDIKSLVNNIYIVMTLT